MLLVIFGAGASYDSVPHMLPRMSAYEDVRPPLANELFDDRPAFVEVMQQFPDFLPLVPHLRGGIQVEQRLAKFLDEAKGYPARHRQLAAIRYYLHMMLWSCQHQWSLHHHGITNYATLLDAIERWRFESHEEVCFVTFNYDLMLDHAMQGVLKFILNDLSSYIGQSNYKLIKLHGSVNWGRLVEGPYPNTIGSPQWLINAAADLKLTDNYTVVNSYPHPMLTDGNRSLVFPALAIPLARKDSFECPKEHVEALAAVIPKVTKLITIGWRATEDHFLNMLRMPLTGLSTDQIDVLVVSGSENGVRETTNNLAFNLTPDRWGSVSSGFSGLTRSLETLDAMLRQTPWQRSH